jgi:hypothetical protein
VECKLARETEVLGKKNLPPVPLCPQQIPYWPDPCSNPATDSLSSVWHGPDTVLTVSVQCAPSTQYTPHWSVT